jgi:transmembrane sensor
MTEQRLNPRDEDPITALPNQLRRVLLDPVDERSVPRMWRRIEERRLRPARPVTILAWALAGAGIAVVMMMMVLLAERWSERPGPRAEASIGALLRADGRALATVDVAGDGAATAVRLADGSQISVHPGGRIEPLASSSREFIVRLSLGTATFDVEPGGPRRWIVEAGLASIEVVGTRFTVTRSVDSVRVEVERGVILVRGATVPDGIARLEAGGTIVVRAPGAPSAAPASADSASADSASADHRGGPPQSAARAEKVDETWRRAAERGDYANAYGDLGAEGLKRESARAASGDDLFELADVARLSGHPAEAVLPLERLAREFSSSARAPLAAVTLGRIELELGDATAASRAFERALALHVPAGLEEDVYARLVEAHVKAGDRAAAHAVGDAYARKFPDGRRRADIGRWLAR